MNLSEYLSKNLKKKPLECNDREGKDLLDVPSFDSEAAEGVLLTVKPVFFFKFEFPKY